MKLFVIAQGKPGPPYMKEGIGDYLQRLRRYLPVSYEELRTPQEVLQKAERCDRLVVCDRGGSTLTSPELARRLEGWMVIGLKKVGFAVGGAEDLAPGLGERADLVLSLSTLTLPHQLVRLILLEQLYRAMTIIRGEPYHRG